MGSETELIGLAVQNKKAIGNKQEYLQLLRDIKKAGAGRKQGANALLRQEFGLDAAAVNTDIQEDASLNAAMDGALGGAPQAPTNVQAPSKELIWTDVK